MKKKSEKIITFVWAWWLTGSFSHNFCVNRSVLLWIKPFKRLFCHQVHQGRKDSSRWCHYVIAHPIPSPILIVMTSETGCFTSSPRNRFEPELWVLLIGQNEALYSNSIFLGSFRFDGVLIHWTVHILDCKKNLPNTPPLPIVWCCYFSHKCYLICSLLHLILVS